MSSIRIHFTTPLYHTITPPYPVIITEPGFLLLARSPERKVDNNGVGVDLNHVWFLVLALSKGIPALVLSSVILKLLLFDSVGRKSILDLASPRQRRNVSCDILVIDERSC